MLKRILYTLLYFIPLINFSQDFSQLWEGHFSYLNVKDVSKGNDKIYAAAENAIFVYDLNTNETETISTINGLSGETISKIHYSEAFGLLVIGYENGLLEIVSDTNEDVLTVIDILEKQTIPPTDKQINHFNEHNDVVYISTDYGISVYNLNNLEFGDTYFIGNSGGQIAVMETAIFEDYIYAACQNNNGLKKALYTSDNLIDYQQWQSIAGGNFSNAHTINEKLFVINNNRNTYQVIDDSLVQLFTFTDSPLDLNSTFNNLIVTTNNNVYIYDDDFILLSTLPIPEEYDTNFTSATLVTNDDVYIGTSNYGLLKTSLANSLEFVEIHPDGPLLNNSFSIDATQNNLWVTFGEYTDEFNPYPLNKRGISRLMNEEWTNISEDSVLNAVNLNKITINPNNSSQVFISSFFDGILELNENAPTILHDNTNSGLESLTLPNNPTYIDIRVAGSNFDNNGVLWCLTALVDNALKSYNPSTNQWQSYSFSSIIEDPFSEKGFKEVVIDNNGNKWLSSYWNGIIGVKTNGGSASFVNIVGEADGGNLPTTVVTALKIDNNNQLWVGTKKGLRVLYNPDSAFNEENPSVDEIIVIDDGIPNELLYQQFISDIEVDGANNKWIGTISTGLYFFSENGQETIYHFTKDNSPLPSNNILDLSIDDSNGKVYIATDNGLVAFKSGGSKSNTDLESVFAYPNPVRPTFNIVDEKIKIKDLSENVNIKITDIEGNLVAEAQSNTNLRYKGYNLEIDGGTAFWNGKNLANNVVASGVYVVLLSDLDTLETKVLKLMVIR